MRHIDLQYRPMSRRLLAVAGVAAAAVTVALVAGIHPQARRPVSLLSPESPGASTSAAAWAHDDSVPDTAETLRRERLTDEEPAPSF